jgi:queuosine precursor transporter
MDESHGIVSQEYTPMLRRGVSPVLLLLVILSVASLVTANIVAVKVISVAGQYVPGGAVVYPLTFLIDDAIVEVYGYRIARATIWLGFLANLVFVVAAELVLVLPSAPYWHEQYAYQSILGYTWRLFAGAFVSYLAGSFANATVMSRMKVATRGRALWARTITSTVAGQGLDSVIFILIAYTGTIPSGSLVRLILTLWVFKSVYEIICTPLVYRSVKILKRIERLDTYDYGISYSPISIPPALRRLRSGTESPK